MISPFSLSLKLEPATADRIADCCADLLAHAISKPFAEFTSRPDDAVSGAEQLVIRSQFNAVPLNQDALAALRALGLDVQIGAFVLVPGHNGAPVVPAETVTPGIESAA